MKNILESGPTPITKPNLKGSAHFASLHESELSDRCGIFQRNSEVMVGHKGRCANCHNYCHYFEAVLSKEGITTFRCIWCKSPIPTKTLHTLSKDGLLISKSQDGLEAFETFSALNIDRLIMVEGDYILD